MQFPELDSVLSLSTLGSQVILCDSHLMMNDDLNFLSITCMPLTETSQVEPRPARLTGYPTGFGK